MASKIGGAPIPDDSSLKPAAPKTRHGAASTSPAAHAADAVTKRTLSKDKAPATTPSLPEKPVKIESAEEEAQKTLAKLTHAVSKSRIAKPASPPRPRSISPTLPGVQENPLMELMSRSRALVANFSTILSGINYGNIEEIQSKLSKVLEEQTAILKEADALGGAARNEVSDTVFVELRALTYALGAKVADIERELGALLKRAEASPDVDPELRALNTQAETLNSLLLQLREIGLTPHEELVTKQNLVDAQIKALSDSRKAVAACIKLGDAASLAIQAKKPDEAASHIAKAEELLATMAQAPTTYVASAKNRISAARLQLTEFYVGAARSTLGKDSVATDTFLKKARETANKLTGAYKELPTIEKLGKIEQEQVLIPIRQHLENALALVQAASPNGAQSERASAISLAKTLQEPHKQAAMAEIALYDQKAHAATRVLATERNAEKAALAQIDKSLTLIRTTLSLSSGSASFNKGMKEWKTLFDAKSAIESTLSHITSYDGRELVKTKVESVNPQLLQRGVPTIDLRLYFQE